ncbi:MAG: YdbH domain-containing protein [Candidatus Polarisedimenticolaceae bacterium]|nr:YdbH domain-containing protein [Candidatus Polarisedimenticolaceae bacterium]
MLTPSAFAVEGIHLQLGQISGPDWSAESLTLELDWQSGATARYRMRMKKLTHPVLSSPLKELLIDCQQGSLSDGHISCQKGMLHLPHPMLDEPQIPIHFQWSAATQKLDLELSRLHIASGMLKATLQSAPEGWQVNLAGEGLDLAALHNLLTAYRLVTFDAELSGRVDLTAALSGVGESPARLQWRAEVHAAAFVDGSGEYLGETLSGSWQGSFAPQAGGWAGDTALTLRQGELLTPYGYIGVEDQPLSIHTRLMLSQQQLQVMDLQYDHPGILAFTASATLLRQPEWLPSVLQLQTRPFAPQSLYQAYFLPILAESTLANLEWAGEAGLELSYQQDGAASLLLKLDDLHLAEAPTTTDETTEGGEPPPRQRRKFALNGINGLLSWTSGQPAVRSTLAWDNGHFMEGITLGNTQLELQLHEKEVTLLSPASIPVLDGSLVVSTFDLSLDSEPHFAFGGALTPISMEALSQALGWLPLSGRLSGGIPKATYQNGLLLLEGAILANLFEGQTIIRDLRIEDLFGAWPTLNANLELKDLDLEALTRTFSFGKITGKLEGRINSLYLENWQPVSFDARFATPEQDKSRHRISQRAIDNISNLGGGGMSGVLSRSFLGLFETFGYARLGVSCRLENGVCEMEGVEAAAQGSYLVKGSGLPRIDIVGYNRRVDWALLIGKLTEIAQSGVGNAEFD